MKNLCNVCPNRCNADRTENKGLCNAPEEIAIAKYYLHPYEEPCISGTKGSGTVFFCGCSLKCVFCQNYGVSRYQTGKTISVNRLADIFKELEDLGAHNINLVTPTHYAEQIMRALDIYKPQIPIVYNTHSYENISTLEKLDPYVDVYLADLKYYSPKVSSRYCGKSNYFEVASEAIKFMMDKKTASFTQDGLLKTGVIVRHLILPLNTDDSIKILSWLNSNVKGNAIVSLMSQYTPFGNVGEFPELQRKITAREYNKVTDFLLEQTDLKDYYLQERKSSDEKYIPDWDF